MSNTVKKHKDTGGETPMVAEYVLGVLEAAEHEAMAREIAQSPQKQAEMRFWQQRFSALDESFEEVAAPQQTLGKIEARLFGTTAYTSPFASLWQNLALWRGLAVGGLAVAALTLGLSIMQPGTITPDATPQLVATLGAADTDVRFLAVYDASRGAVRIAGVSGDPVPDRDFELWFIQGENAPVSMGIIPVNSKVEVPLSAEMQSAIAEGIVLAVSLEPLGGAPQGQPTGPIVAAGTVSAV